VWGDDLVFFALAFFQFSHHTRRGKGGKGGEKGEGWGGTNRARARARACARGRHQTSPGARVGSRRWSRTLHHPRLPHRPRRGDGRRRRP